MKTRKLALTVILGAFLLILVASGVWAQDVDKLKFPKLNKLEIPQTEKVTLDNGIRLYFLEDKSLPLFNVRVRMNVGSYLDPFDKVGLASICGSTMRTGGTQKWTGDEIDEMLEGIGGSVEVGIDDISGSAGISVLSEYSDLALEVLAEVLRRPVFDQDKIDLSKMQERSGVSRRNDNPGGVALREWRKLVYGPDSPFSRHTEYASIEAIARDDLVNFHKAYVAPENMQMAIIGDYDRDAVMALLDQYFGDWAQSGVPVPPLPKVDYNWRSKVYYVEKPEAAQSYVRIGHLGGLVTDDDYADKIVMNAILGGGFGSRLTDAVRTQMGLAYSVGGRYISNIAYPGYFFAVGSTGPENTVKAAKEMIKQIKSMQTRGPSEEEMQKGKDGYLNSFVFNFDTKQEVVTRMMTYDFYGLPEDFLQQEKEGVEKVTPEDVMEAAKRNLHPDSMMVLVVGNGEAFDEPLESLGLGPVDTLDITIPPAVEESQVVITPESLERGKGLLDQAVAATGGLDNLKAVQSVHQKGTMTLVMGPQEMPVGVKTIEVLPDKHRNEMNLMGRNIFEVRNGDVGWKTNPMTGELAEMSGDEIAKDDESVARNLINILSHADNPYYQAVYNGDGEVAGTAVDWVAIMGADGEAICQLALDAADHHLVGQKYWGESMTGEGMLEEAMSDYASVNGVQMPMKTVVTMDGQKVMQVVVSECVINGEVPADAFDKPTP
ncbi:MAG: insulinase family protein [candidate division Zixibacteria bacterium]|nr:insulinase family protein [candidate division Zixibacteria bacterium]MDH3937822.1 insulinase family protein [candidate division Zixibacteria bacterium]MDH4033265.1 insulinase family protein [candidate division Zixibacteria bacterium]